MPRIFKESWPSFKNSSRLFLTYMTGMCYMGFGDTCSFWTWQHYTDNVSIISPISEQFLVVLYIVSTAVRCSEAIKPSICVISGQKAPQREAMGLGKWSIFIYAFKIFLTVIAWWGGYLLVKTTESQLPLPSPTNISRNNNIKDS